MPLVALMALAAIDLMALGARLCNLRLWHDVASTTMDVGRLEPGQITALGMVSRSADRPVWQVGADSGILRHGRHDGRGLCPWRARRCPRCGCRRVAVTGLPSSLLLFAVSAPSAYRMVRRILWTGHE